MRTVNKGNFAGTAAEYKAHILARVQAFVAAKVAHGLTVAQPAPREEELVEYLARTGEDFDVDPDLPEIPPLTQEELDAIAAENARRDAVKADVDAAALIAQLSTATPAQINTFVNNQVNDLADARLMFKRILLVLSIMGRP